MKKIFSSIINFSDHNTNDTIKKSTAGVLVKVFAQFFSLILSISIARFIGADGLGLLNLSFRITGIFLILSILGFDQILIKNISIGLSKNDKNKVGSLIFSSLIFNGVMAIFFAFLGGLFSSFVANILEKPDLKWPLFIAFVAIIPQVLAMIFSSGMKAFGKVWQASLFSNGLVSIIVLLCIVFCFYFGYEINLIRISIFYVIAKFMLLFASCFYWKLIFKEVYVEKFIVKEMLYKGFKVFLVSGSAYISASLDIFILGYFSDSSEIGLYTVALLLASFISFILPVVNISIAPKIASMYNTKDYKNLISLLKNTIFILLIISLLIFICFALSGSYLLQFWGNEFSEGYTILLILSIGQLFNMSSGPTGNFLIMAGFEKIHSKISIFCLLINIFLSVTLVKAFGVTGIAASTAFSVFLENSLKFYFTKKILKFKF